MPSAPARPQAERAVRLVELDRRAHLAVAREAW